MNPDNPNFRLKDGALSPVQVELMETKRVLNAALEELSDQRRIITRLELENSELKSIVTNKGK